jgi:hypothetical protein
MIIQLVKQTHLKYNTITKTPAAVESRSSLIMGVNLPTTIQIAYYVDTEDQ